MVYQMSEKVQRPLAFGIIDEVDSILIDEARTPLIISGQSEENTALYLQVNQVPPRLIRQDKEDSEGDYSVDEKSRQVLLSEAGHEKVEAILTEMGLLPEGGSLYDAANIMLMHHVYASLRAHALFFKDQHYVVQNDEVIIVDEFTGRLMSGRRWSEGLHQAVEAKEGVSIQKENQTLASITFQNYFRMYEKAVGHDRHGGHRGVRVPEHLRPGNRGHPDPSADDPQGRARPGLPHRKANATRR
jgi:preprotein translocase subunit SecA